MTTKVPLTPAELHEIIDPVPMIRMLGFRVLETAPGELHCEVAPPPQTLGSPATGAIHGGAVASFIDIAGTSVFCAGERRKDIVTVDIRVDFHRPALGERFLVRSWIVNQSRTLLVSEAEVRNPEGKLIASGRVLSTWVNK